MKHLILVLIFGTLLTESISVAALPCYARVLNINPFALKHIELKVHRSEKIAFREAVREFQNLKLYGQVLSFRLKDRFMGSATIDMVFSSQDPFFTQQALGRFLEKLHDHGLDQAARSLWAQIEI